MNKQRSVRCSIGNKCVGQHGGGSLVDHRIPCHSGIALIALGRSSNRLVMRKAVRYPGRIAIPAITAIASGSVISSPRSANHGRASQVESVAHSIPQIIAITKRVWIWRYGRELPNQVEGVKSVSAEGADPRAVSRDPVGAILARVFSSVLVIRTFG